MELQSLDTVAAVVPAGVLRLRHTAPESGGQQSFVVLCADDGSEEEIVRSRDHATWPQMFQLALTIVLARTAADE